MCWRARRQCQDQCFAVSIFASSTQPAYCYQQVDRICILRHIFPSTARYCHTESEYLTLSSSSHTVETFRTSSTYCAPLHPVMFWGGPRRATQLSGFIFAIHKRLCFNFSKTIAISDFFCISQKRKVGLGRDFPQKWGLYSPKSIM